MYILIEEHQYDASIIKNVIYGIDALTNIDGKVSIHYVGYYYNSLLKDCVFILPKVLLEDKKGKDFVFGKYLPEELIKLKDDSPLTSEEKNFIYKFAVWIYRAIVVYKNTSGESSDIVFYSRIAQMGNSNKRIGNTYLDIILSLLQFNKNNKNFFLYIIKNLHKGYNKINWPRTIGTQTAFVQNDQLIYLKLINKKRQIDFDEELFIIYFSILNYIGDTFGFSKNINCNYEIIKGKRFECYLRGLGKKRLLQIKYKYYSDRALHLWQLCYAFFNESNNIVISSVQKEYLLVKSFHIVFESIIDELVGDNPLPDGMDKKQEDGKIVDHLFTAKSLIEGDVKNTYYIGDSKYYKIGHELGSESIYKQYTYARNVIQWNLDIFNNNLGYSSQIKLRDELTEGYNIIPNFFISAKLDKSFNYSIDGIEKTDRRHNKHKKYQFKNRLFDRDTLLLFHYDVNFLFILSLYARNNTSQKIVWKQKIRDKFRYEIQRWLEKDYKFYVLRPKKGSNDIEFINRNFKQLIGKIFCPYKDIHIYYLALDCSKSEFENENKQTLILLENDFYIAECKLGDDPEDTLEKLVC